MAEAGGLRTVRYWEADGVSGRRLMLRPFSKGSNLGNVRVGSVSDRGIAGDKLGVGSAMEPEEKHHCGRGLLHRRLTPEIGNKAAQ